MDLRLSQAEAVFLSFAARRNRQHQTVENVDAALEEDSTGDVHVEVPEEELEEMHTWIAMHQPRDPESKSSVLTLLAKLAKGG